MIGLAVLVPGLFFDFLVPGSPLVRKIWSLVEIILALQLARLIWARNEAAPGWLTSLLKAPAEEVGNIFPLFLILPLLFDGFRLAIGFGLFGPTQAPYLELMNPTWWSVTAISIALAIQLANEPLTGRFLLLGLLALLAHQFLLLFSKDIFAARSQMVIYLVLALALVGRVSVRAGLLGLAVGFIVLEPWVKSLAFYQGLDFPWPDPQVDQLDTAYETWLNQAAIASSGPWGLGLEYWDRLDLFRPGPIPTNAPTYLVVWLGLYGTALYLIVQSIFLTALTFRAQFLPLGWPRAVAIALGFTLTINLGLSLLAALGAMGHYDPLGLAFVGSNQVGALSLALACFVFGWLKFDPPEPTPAAAVGEEEPQPTGSV
ncbi:MAG: hypothetical protein LBR11_02955 [Deltaproteobacteria bacterium]|nr:hypothetical protein [Deltaproteobacteria bacterium]